MAINNSSHYFKYAFDWSVVIINIIYHLHQKLQIKVDVTQMWAFNTIYSFRQNCNLQYIIIYYHSTRINIIAFLYKFVSDLWILNRTRDIHLPDNYIFYNNSSKVDDIISQLPGRHLPYIVRWVMGSRS